jgi:hypothetical protein
MSQRKNLAKNASRARNTSQIEGEINIFKKDVSIAVNKNIDNNNPIRLDFLLEQENTFSFAFDEVGRILLLKKQQTGAARSWKIGLLLLLNS